MTIDTTPEGYAVTLDVGERNQLLIACEYALAAARGEPQAPTLLAELDPDWLDALTDALFLVTQPAAA